jgi:hypothetical protein
MRPRASAALLAAILACFAAGSASAQSVETGGVQINGVVNDQTVVDGSANVALGAGSRAVMSVGSIEQGVRIRTGYIANVASGPGEEAVTSVGSVHDGSRLAGSTNVVISTGQIINMSDHSGRPACVVIGSTGGVPGC